MGGGEGERGGGGWVDDGFGEHLPDGSRGGEGEGGGGGEEEGGDGEGGSGEMHRGRP